MAAGLTTMKACASQLCSYTPPLPSGRKSPTVACSSVSPTPKSAANLNLKRNNHSPAKEAADRIGYSTNDNTPWGYASICGTRQQQQQAVVVAVPQFLNGTTTPQLTSLAGAPFFAIYDGHGGSQVANYCGDRLHSALTEELETILTNMNDRKEFFMSLGFNFDRVDDNEWRKALARCFRKVDAEVEAKHVVEPHVSPEPIGSTAVVAIVCPSYIVVANCGDSRAVLKRDQELIPLSVDHKTARGDEYARIEGAGGKIKRWHPGYENYTLIVDDYHASAYLGFPRAIGDSHWNKPWKPWAVPDPEVTLIPRTKGDKCLVLASDGLWDVMTNAEVCDTAEEMIRRLHVDFDGLESASRAAAEYLLNRAIERGSVDNISVLVVLSTLQNFFMKIDAKKIRDGLIYEALEDSDNVFPHFYDPSRSFSPLPLAGVAKAEKLTITDGKFECSLLN